jgi:hypothetical protein
MGSLITIANVIGVVFFVVVMGCCLAIVALASIAALLFMWRASWCVISIELESLREWWATRRAA